MATAEIDRDEAYAFASEYLQGTDLKEKDAGSGWMFASGQSRIFVSRDGSAYRIANFYPTVEAFLGAIEDKDRREAARIRRELL